jgi:serine protease DegQ
VRRLLLVLVLVLVLPALAACSGSDESTVTVTRTETETVSTGTSTTAVIEGSFDTIPDIVDRVEPSVVAVETDSGEGSGVIWDDTGVIVTNHHVVAGANRVRVALASGARLPARLLATDQRSDVAVLRVEREGLPAARFEPSLPRVGELAIAMGNPAGFEQSVTAGIVSGLHRAIPSGGQTPALVDLIQTDAAISPGNSGGALVNANGEVVGINVAYLPPTESGAVAIGFAIPAGTVVSVVRQLLDTGEVRRAYLGVIYGVQVTPDLNQQFGLGVESGVTVEDVPADTPAAKAGIQGGDVIVSLDGRPIRAQEDLIELLNLHRPGERVTVGIVRDGERRQVPVTLAERP